MFPENMSNESYNEYDVNDTSDDQYVITEKYLNEYIVLSNKYIYNISLSYYRHPYYENMIRMAERYDKSDTAIVACVSGLFVDIKMVTAGNRQKILDRCAIRRQRQRCRQENMPDLIDFSGLYIIF